MIKLVNGENGRVEVYNQQAGGMERNSQNKADSEKQSSEAAKRNKGVFFQTNEKNNSNWRKKNSMYNSRGRKTSNIFNSPTSNNSPLKMQSPVSGKPIISSDYGEDRGSYIHKGIDFDGKLGDKISSAANGKVIFAGYTKSGGNEVVIQHANNVVTKYAHLEEMNVKEGQFVKAGEQIGTMGNTGNSHTADGDDGSHLHFEVLEKGQNVDPDKYLNLRKAKHEKGDYGSPNICGTVDSCGSGGSCGSTGSSNEGNENYLDGDYCGGVECGNLDGSCGSSGSSEPSGSGNTIYEGVEKQEYTTGDALAGVVARTIEDGLGFLHWLVSPVLDTADVLAGENFNMPSTPEVEAGDSRTTNVRLQKQSNGDITVTTQTTYHLDSKNKTVRLDSVETTFKFVGEKNGEKYYKITDGPFEGQKITKTEILDAYNDPANYSGGIENYSGS